MKIRLLYLLSISTIAAAILLLPATNAWPQTKTDEQAAITTIEALGGKIERDETRSGKPVTKINLGGTKATQTTPPI